MSEERVEQQENTPPANDRAQDREKDAGPFFISFGDEGSGETKGTVIKPKPKLRPRLQPSRDEVSFYGIFFNTVWERYISSH